MWYKAADTYERSVNLLIQLLVKALGVNDDAGVKTAITLNNGVLEFFCFGIDYSDSGFGGCFFADSQKIRDWVFSWSSRS